MTSDTLADIKRFGLSVRQIPLEDVSTFDPRHYQEGDERITWNGRDMVRRVRIPEHAGWWMCQKSRDTSSGVFWNKKLHNLAPTLEESVALYKEKHTDAS